MTAKKFNWDEILKSFDEVERKILNNEKDLDIDSFFKNFHENIAVGSGVEKRHLLDAKERIRKILNLIENMKKDLLAQKVALTENSKKLKKYKVASVLKTK